MRCVQHRLRIEAGMLRERSRRLRTGIDEAVTGSWFGEEVARPGGVALDLAPKLGDVYVQVVGLGLVRGAPDLAQDHPVREQLALVEREETKERELVRSELDSRPVAMQSAVLEIETQLPDADDRLPGRPDPARGCPPQGQALCDP